MSADGPELRRTPPSEAVEELAAQVEETTSTARRVAEIAQDAVARATQTREAAQRVRAQSAQLKARVERARGERATKSSPSGAGGGVPGRMGNAERR